MSNKLDKILNEKTETSKDIDNFLDCLLDLFKNSNIVKDSAVLCGDSFNYNAFEVFNFNIYL